MATSLQEIEDLWNGGAGDAEAVRALADEYVAANAAAFADLAEKPIEALVKAVDIFRQAGMKSDQQRIECWLWHHFEPQNIGGVPQATVRNVI
jgi:hypothetical protein